MIGQTFLERDVTILSACISAFFPRYNFNGRWNAIERAQCVLFILGLQCCLFQRIVPILFF